MGNSSSSSGEFLGSDTPPYGHGEAILAAPQQHPDTIQPAVHAPAHGRPQLGLRQLVWNPFDLPNREHCPDLQQALAYDPHAPSQSSGPSIEDLSRAQQEDLAAQVCVQQQPPAASPEAEAACQAALASWFQHRADTRVCVGRNVCVCVCAKDRANMPSIDHKLPT